MSTVDKLTSALNELGKVKPRDSASNTALSRGKQRVREARADLEAVVTPSPAPEPAPAPAPTPSPEPSPASAPGPRLWGLWDDNGQGNMIWLSSEWDAIEKQFGKLGLVHYGQEWGKVDSGTMAMAASRGGTPLLDIGNTTTTSTDSILNGSQDAALARMDTALRNYGKPVILRPLWEMNGNWYVWGQKSNYAAAWRYMHEKITAPNVKWLWCPNYRFAGSSAAVDPTPYYPGDKYVDYVGADVYMENWTAHEAADLILADIHRIAPSKPAIIAEWGVSKSKNANRPAAITEFLKLLPDWVVGQCYFNWNTGGAGDWRLTDAASVVAYKAGL